MRICYVLLSPTWGMHQYTAGLAHDSLEAGHDVHLVTTRRAPLDRYSPRLTVHTPVDTRNTGFSLRDLPLTLYALRYTERALREDVIRKDVMRKGGVVHFTGPHLVNPLLLHSLRRAGVPAVHTLHDLHPHHGAAYGRLLYLWNRWVVRAAGHILVHGQCYRQELLAQGLPASRVSYSPLTHLFVGYEWAQGLAQALPELRYEPWALFLGRLEAYKGLAELVASAHDVAPGRIVIAGPGRLERLVEGPLPANVEVRDHLVDDEEAIDLFARCGLVVLPYVEASQSALVAAAYVFHKPVVVTRAGALPEYVVEGETGWVVPPGDAGALGRTVGAALADPERLARMGQAGRAWYERQREAEIAWLEANGYDERFRRMWRYYLAFCEAGFREGRIDLVQFLLEKP